MENDYLQALAQVVLPTEILDYFSITGIAQTTTEIHISLEIGRASCRERV